MLIVHLKWLGGGKELENSWERFITTKTNKERNLKFTQAEKYFLPVLPNVKRNTNSLFAWTQSQKLSYEWPKNNLRYAKLIASLFFICSSNYKERCRLAKSKHEHNNNVAMKQLARKNKRNRQTSICTK